MKATTALLKLLPSSLESAESLKKTLEKRGDPAPVPKALVHMSAITEEVVQNQLVLTLTPRRNPVGKQLIYLHGGAYVNPMVSAHWTIVRQIMARTGATVTVPYYGLAPEHTAAEAYSFLGEVSRQVTDRAAGQPIYFAGDSAGAGLALGQAIRLRDTGGNAPSGVFLFSPWLDVTMSNPDIWDVLPNDPMLAPGGLIAAGTAWAGQMDVRDPLISPINDSLANLPPLFVYQGGNDIFLPDAKALARKAGKAGAPLELRLFRDGFHVFVGAPWTPEARQTFNHVASIINAPAKSR